MLDSWIAFQSPLSMAFPRQKYWSGSLFPFPENLHGPGIEPMSSALQVDSVQLTQQGIPIKIVPVLSCFFCFVFKCKHFATKSPVQLKLFFLFVLYQR